MVSDELYQVIFDGTLSGDIELEQVKKNLAAMFKMNATQVEAMFSGKPIVIKRNVDSAAAEKYRAAFLKAGAKCSLVGSQPSAEESLNTTPSESGERATGRMAGKDIINKEVPADLSNLSMGAAGETIPTQQIDRDFKAPDLSGLSVSEDDDYLVEPTEKPEPDVDISGLSVEDID